MIFIFIDWSKCRAHSDMKSSIHGVQKYEKQNVDTYEDPI